MKKPLAFAGRLAAAGAGLAGAAYAAYVGITWLRYGRASARVPDESRDLLLDQFMPTCEVVERHHVRVDAPATVTFKAATEMYLEQSPIVRWIFKAREWAMGSHPASRDDAAPFLSRMRDLGWGVLAEVPGREVVMGAVTQPWMADVVFRPLPPEEFASFQEPDHVKIAWTLRADPVGPETSIFPYRDTSRQYPIPAARKKFRRYWAFASPGIILIRWAALGPLKSEAERRRRRAPGRLSEKESLVG